MFEYLGNIGIENLCFLNVSCGIADYMHRVHADRVRARVHLKIIINSDQQGC